MTKDCKLEERKFILECIEVYRELPCLWKITSTDYCNRAKKEAAYCILLSKYQERFENATKEDVKKKFNSLRTNFRKELKKIYQSEKSGAGTDKLYETNLWYFDAMLFLQDPEMPVSSRSSLEESWNESNTTWAEENTEQDDVTDAPDFDTSSQVSVGNKTKTKKKRFIQKCDEVMSLVCKKLKGDETEDEITSSVKAWGYDLRLMKPDQQIFAKKAINDILFEGRLGTLHRNSVQINAAAQQSLVHGPYPCTVSSAASRPITPS